MEAIEYKGYEIKPSTQQRTESGQWTLRVLITKHRCTEGVTNEQFFDTAVTFDEKEEAEKQAIIYGKKIVDGKIPSVNVSQL